VVVKELLKNIPKMDLLLEHPGVEEVLRTYPRWLVVDALRRILKERRQRIVAGEGDPTLVDVSSIVRELQERIDVLSAPSLRRVINATGVVLHTNLGRALLAREVWRQMEEVALNYSNLEYDLGKGERGLRYVHVEEILKKVTGAPGVMVVNNNAGAVLLVLASLAWGKEVVVSRGELIEIGGSFRIPDVMAASGAVLREVGTTNKTHLGDYEAAISENTALLMKVHPSNYRVLGFTQSVPLKDLVVLGKEHGLPVYEDLGSGNLVDLRAYSLPYEPTVQDSLRAGVSVLSFSGDKLLGGPQAGIILGDEGFIERIRRHPLNRALRIDKLTLSGLEATLRLYMDSQSLAEKLPTLAFLATPLEVIKVRAQRLKTLLEDNLPSSFVLEVMEDSSYVGGGALPLAEMPTAVVAVTHQELSSGQLDERARRSHPPVVGRIKHDAFCLDLRTVREEEVELLSSSLGRCFS